MPTHKRWRCKKKTYVAEKGKHTLEQFLNKWGKNGWELVQCLPHMDHRGNVFPSNQICLFKRPVKTKPLP